MKEIVVIIQARMGSTRLPGKIMKDLCGKPVLWHIYNRLSYSKKKNKIVIATTGNKEDDIVEQFCKENNIHSYRGSESDVLLRYYESAKLYCADIIIRITSDCPLIDPQILDSMIEQFDTINVDYLSNLLMRTFPRGLDVEIFTFHALEKAHQEAKKVYEREHVTPYFYQNPGIFSLYNYQNKIDYSFHRWTLDTEDDYKLIEKIYEKLYSKGQIFFWNDVLYLFEKFPGLYEINKQVQQKDLR